MHIFHGISIGINRIYFLKSHYVFHLLVDNVTKSKNLVDFTDLHDEKVRIFYLVVALWPVLAKFYDFLIRSNLVIVFFFFFFTFFFLL